MLNVSIFLHPFRSYTSQPANSLAYCCHGNSSPLCHQRPLSQRSSASLIRWYLSKKEKNIRCGCCVVLFIL